MKMCKSYKAAFWPPICRACACVQLLDVQTFLLFSPSASASEHSVFSQRAWQFAYGVNAAVQFEWVSFISCGAGTFRRAVLLFSTWSRLVLGICSTQSSFVLQKPVSVPCSRFWAQLCLLVLFSRIDSRRHGARNSSCSARNAFAAPTIRRNNWSRFVNDE